MNVFDNILPALGVHCHSVVSSASKHGLREIKLRENLLWKRCWVITTEEIGESLLCLPWHQGVIVSNMKSQYDPVISSSRGDEVQNTGVVYITPDTRWAATEAQQVFVRHASMSDTALHGQMNTSLTAWWQNTATSYILGAALCSAEWRAYRRADSGGYASGPRHSAKERG